MWLRIGLKARLFAILAALVSISLCGGLVMIRYTYRIETLFALVTEKHLASYTAAENLESALVNQKGFVSYYLIDGDPDWLRQLGEYRRIFTVRLEEAFRLCEESAEQRIKLSRIKTEYQGYITQTDRVIELYQSGDISEGKALHQTVRGSFFTILDLCEAFKAYHMNRIEHTRLYARSQAKTLRILAGSAMAASLLIAAVLIVLLIKQILGPVHRLALETVRDKGAPSSENDIAILRHGVKDLIRNVDSTRMELERSRETLLQSEKLALVGKLAAGMAHSIRNPFTSVKMRLFSLGRTLKLTDTQQDDLAVISDEIRHIDTIVQNFLEFSRPPKLQFQRISPSLVVDQVLQLLSHRLKSYDVDVAIIRETLLPEIEADPEQLKEVLVNLIVNACEAMEQNGKIEIVERNGDDVVFIEIRDNGPGIPETLQPKIFQPFFTTKEDGTGLGLSIATRIIEEHRGRLSVSSNENRGTVFTILLPFPEVRS